MRLLKVLSVTRDNVGYAVRGLLRSPAFTAAVVVTLALGIGVNATMFGIIDRLLLSAPAQVKEPNQVRRVYVRLHERRTGELVHQRATPYLDYRDWQAARSFASVAAYWSHDMTLGHGVDAFRLNGGLALVVAALGLYSVLAFNVAQRTHEIGVRSALGATRGRIVRQVLRESLTLAAIGIALGLVIAVAAGGTVAPLLYEISPRDPVVLITVTVMLLLTAAAAGLVPASRAARIDPNAALRVE